MLYFTAKKDATQSNSFIVPKPTFENQSTYVNGDALKIKFVSQQSLHQTSISLTESSWDDYYSQFAFTMVALDGTLGSGNLTNIGRFNYSIEVYNSVSGDLLERVMQGIAVFDWVDSDNDEVIYEEHKNDETYKPYYKANP